MTFSLNYINNLNRMLDTKVLKTVQCLPESTSCNWGNILDDIISEFGIKKEKISGVVAGWCREPLLDALAEKGISHFPCFLQTIQMCAQTCFCHESVAPCINRVRAGVKEQLEEDEPIFDHNNHWCSTYNLLETILNLRYTTNLIYEIDDRDWNMVKDLIEVLAPFKTTVLTLSETSFPLMSVIQPIVWQLTMTYFKAKPSDSDIVSELKDTISTFMSTRYKNIQPHLFFESATYLDPRFKLLPCVPQKAIAEVKTSLHKSMTLKPLVKVGTNMSTQENKRKSGMELLMGNVCNVTYPLQLRPEQQADAEICSYEKDTVSSLDQCPLQWWFLNILKYPNMYQIAMTFICIPVCSVPFNRLCWRNAILHHNKRASLRSDTVDKLLFLHSNGVELLH